MISVTESAELRRKHLFIHPFRSQQRLVTGLGSRRGRPSRGSSPCGVLCCGEFAEVNGDSCYRVPTSTGGTVGRYLLPQTTFTAKA